MEKLHKKDAKLEVSGCIKNAEVKAMEAKAVVSEFVKTHGQKVKLLSAGVLLMISMMEPTVIGTAVSTTASFVTFVDAAARLCAQSENKAKSAEEAEDGVAENTPLLAAGGDADGEQLQMEFPFDLAQTLATNYKHASAYKDIPSEIAYRALSEAAGISYANDYECSVGK